MRINNRLSFGAIKPEDWHRVTNLSDFEIHVTSHINRVRILGNFISKKYFKDLETSKVDEYLSLHDAEKLIDTPDFRRVMGISEGEKSLLERLYRHFGRHREVRTQEEIIEFENTRFQLNEFGSLISDRWMLVNKLWDHQRNEPLEQGKSLVTIDHLADVLDRELDPVAHHELGKTIADQLMFPHSADLFVKTEQEREILKHMRPLYPKLVDGQTYMDWMRREFSPPSKIKQTTDRATVFTKLFLTL